MRSKTQKSQHPHHGVLRTVIETMIEIRNRDEAAIAPTGRIEIGVTSVIATVISHASVHGPLISTITAPGWSMVLHTLTAAHTSMALYPLDQRLIEIETERRQDRDQAAKGVKGMNKMNSAERENAQSLNNPSPQKMATIIEARSEATEKTLQSLPARLYVLPRPRLLKNRNNHLPLLRIHTHLSVKPVIESVCRKRCRDGRPWISRAQCQSAR